MEIRQSRVDGNIHVSGGGSANSYINIWQNTVVTRGNVHVHGRDGGAIAVVQTHIENGNLTLQQNVATHSLWIGHSTVSRNVQLQQNEFPIHSRLPVNDNQVGQNLIVIKNEGRAGKQVQNNRVDHNLICHQNDEPFIGHPNQARRSIGQCGSEVVRP